jgi:hypothetical protein
VGDPALEGDEAAVRVAEEEHLGDVEPFEQQSGTARVLRHVVSAAGKEAAPSRTDRVEVDHRQVPLQRRHPQIAGVDARPARVDDTDRAAAGHLIGLANALDLDGVPPGGEVCRRHAGDRTAPEFTGNVPVTSSAM